MKSIYTLIPDIYALINSKGGWDNVCFDRISTGIGQAITKERGAPSLRLSQMGPKCPRALWHSIHTPELAEPLPPWAQIKYTYGHIIEALIIELAKAAGHEVLGEQDEIILDGVVGHRDCVIDGAIVDVKSASSIGFKKFQDKTLSQSDSFGYLDQLDGYVVGSIDDPLVRVKDRGYLLAVDKTLGHLCLYEHFSREESIRNRIQYYRGIVGRPNPPPCECRSIPDGKSGNLKLDIQASYNAYKFCCNPNVRTFKYATGPVYLTKVVRVPDVPELTRTLH